MGSTLRFTGLASGLDTESVVKALLTNYQSKIDKQTGNKKKAEWKQEIYTDLNSKLKAFESSLSNLMNSGNLYSAKSTVSKEGILSVKNVDYNGDENHSIVVKQVATKASIKTMVMDKYIDSDGNEQKVTSQTSLNDIFGITDTMEVSAVNETGRNVTIKIGNAKIDLGECSTIKDIVDAIRDGNKREGQHDSDVQVNFNDSIGAFTISSKVTGADQVLEITGVAEDGSDVVITNGSVELEALVKLGIGCSVTAVNSDGSRSLSFTGGAQGTNAVVEYNNSLTVESASNEIEVNGLTFSVQTVTDTAVIVSVTQDSDKMYDKIKSFIDSYNSLLGEITTKYYADSAAKYEMLTDEKKEAMSDKEVEAWENKIKGSLLRRDDSLQYLYDTFRGIMNDDYSKPENGGLDGAFSMLAQIGIRSSDWTAQGKLEIKESDLKTAIATNADKVGDLLSNLAKSFDKQLNKLANKSTDYKSYGSFFNDKLLKDEISSYADAMQKAQDKYDRMESYYYAKFSAMENALNNANSSSSLFSNL